MKFSSDREGSEGAGGCRLPARGAPRRRRQLLGVVDFDGFVDFDADVPSDFEAVLAESLDVDFVSDDLVSDDFVSDDLDSDVPLSDFDGESVVVDDDFLPRLSVLKKPDPLNVTPTGVKTFLTGLISPVSGWATSVSVSSWNPCWTSIVSPVSTNL